jgi:hypothetical protein
LNDRHDDQTDAAPGVFDARVDDAIIVPLALIALAAKTLFSATLSLLIRILDYAFPILLQLVRFPLFTLRIIGDGVAALADSILGWLPLSGAKRAAWREFVRRNWAWLRERISYRAFEEALHHAFEGGMAWVFRKCRTLTPGGALLVIAGAVLWLPISFGVATAMHAILLAKATVLPAWMQLLHPLATLIAKSKLLVLPVYPAAWPQAKQHPLVQAVFDCYRRVTALDVAKKLVHRYQQLERAAARGADAIRHTAARTGVSALCGDISTELRSLAASIGSEWRAAMTHLREVLVPIPLIGRIVQSYAAHYGNADHRDREKLSDKLSGLFARWSINFSAEYYEAKDRLAAAQQQTRLRGT